MELGLKTINDIENGDVTALEETGGSDMLSLLRQPANGAALLSDSSVIVGDLLGLKDDGRTPLVAYPGQLGSAAVPAGSVVDLNGAHIGKRVVLTFERGEVTKPIIIGVLRERDGWPAPQGPPQVEVDADGERLIIGARQQLVLRCGHASITLTKEGKILIQGTFVSSRSSGVNRIRGASVQIN